MTHGTDERAAHDGPTYTAGTIRQRLAWMLNARVEWEMENADDTRAEFYKKQYEDRMEVLAKEFDALRAYAEHRELCRECWTGIRLDAPGGRGLCREGVRLRDAAWGA